jgi:selenocysteine lyase/cysteine desulfurase
MEQADKKYYDILFSGIYRALEYYSNVHRGSGHHSIITTRLYEKAREEVLNYLGLESRSWGVVFGSPAGIQGIAQGIPADDHRIISSAEINLPFGVCALAVRLKAFPNGVPYYTGGGTTRLYSRNWVIWTDRPDLYEAGTPAIINVIGFARALNMIRKYGNDIFRTKPDEGMGHRFSCLFRS